MKKLYNFFISSEGCLDTFLVKAPIFREGYDSTMSSESEHEKDSLSGHQSDPEVMMTYLTNNEPEDSGCFTSVRFVCGNERERYTVQRDAPFKELLTKYMYRIYVCSIKSLRITHNERTLFVSSIGKKTPLDLGITDFDTLEITIIQSTPTEEPPKQPSSKGKKKKNNNNKKKHKKSKKKRPVQIAPPEDEMEKAKKEWMFSLYRVFAEAEPTFKEIRQRLNAMNLERTKPKQRISSPSKTTEPVEVVDNPLGDDQLGGKAGRHNSSFK